MNPRIIPSLLSALAATPSFSKVSNPYSNPSAQHNLGVYLSALCSHPYSGHLFVGEAPGHRGCAITGIPFTSERILRSRGHAFLNALFPALAPMGNVTERSATIVWQQFAGKRSLPAFWNAFPLHPHPANVSNKNVSPTAVQILAGIPFLQTIVQILDPHTIVAVGGVAQSMAAQTFPHLHHISLLHPSYRGTAGFILGCAALHIP